MSINKMWSLTRILRDVLSGTTECCCLCFTTLGENETPYNIEDEVVTCTDTVGIQLYEMISTVLGDKVLDSISAFKMICQKCTDIVLSSYKFIQQCRRNIEQLQHTIHSLLIHSETLNDTPDYKSLFVGVDTSNYNVKFYYDKHRNLNNKSLLHKRFQRIQKDSHQIYIQIEMDTEYSVEIEKSAVKRRKQSSILQSLDLADILHDKDDPNMLKCKTCLKLFPTVMKLKLHYQRVHAPKNFKCSQCPRSFGSSILLKQHTKDCHCDAVCSQCGKTYTNLYSLRHHEQGHRQRFVCQTCGKIYKGKQQLKNHIEKKLCEKMRKSNAEATLSCDYCGKKYAQKPALSVHIRLEHENGKALTCDWCGKRVSSISRLKDHIVKHTKQKNFECEQCGGKFVTKTSLLYHTRIHTGEKPYKCEHCAMTFLSASRRSEHVKRHHTQANLECDICHGKFKGDTCYARHRRKHFDMRSRLYWNPPALE